MSTKAQLVSEVDELLRRDEKCGRCINYLEHDLDAILDSQSEVEKKVADVDSLIKQHKETRGTHE